MYKKNFVFIFILAIFALGISEVHAQAEGRKIHIEIDIVWGRTSKDCKGSWFCKGTTISFTKKLKAKLNESNLGNPQANGSLNIVFGERVLENGKPITELFAEKGDEYDFSPELCRQFECQGLTMIPGRYVLDFRTNPNGSVDVPVIIR